MTPAIKLFRLIVSFLGLLMAVAAHNWAAAGWAAMAMFLSMETFTESDLDELP